MKTITGIEFTITSSGEVDYQSVYEIFKKSEKVTVQLTDKDGKIITIDGYMAEYRENLI